MLDVLCSHMYVMEHRPRIDGLDTATAIIYNMNEDCQCVVTTSNFRLKAICKEQSLCHNNKLLATTANPKLFVFSALWQ